MTNKLNEKKSMLVPVAIIVSLLFALSGLTVGMIFSVRLRLMEDERNEARMSAYLIVDASNGLRSKASALRLCNNEETAEKVMEEALVYAVRAETALECDGGVWCECRAKEAFLNDAVSLLSGKTSVAMQKSDVLYAYSTALCSSYENSTEFEYNGELADGNTASADEEEPTQADIEKAKEKIAKTLEADTVEYIGHFGGKTEFDITVGDRHGYAEVCGDKVCEFALSGGATSSDKTENAGGAGSAESDEEVALATAEKCGYDGLKVYSSSTVGGVTTVKLTHEIKGAACRDECASVLIESGKPIGFTAGQCENGHTLPSVKVKEIDARKNAAGADFEGRLVTTNDGTRDRVCYEYAVECEDGVHYVYVCAENGEQMQVR